MDVAVGAEEETDALDVAATDSQVTEKKDIYLRASDSAVKELDSQTGPIKYSL